MLAPKCRTVCMKYRDLERFQNGGVSAEVDVLQPRTHRPTSYFTRSQPELGLERNELLDLESREGWCLHFNHHTRNAITHAHLERSDTNPAWVQEPTAENGNAGVDNSGASCQITYRAPVCRPRTDIITTWRTIEMKVHLRQRAHGGNRSTKDREGMTLRRMLYCHHHCPVVITNHDSRIMQDIWRARHSAPARTLHAEPLRETARG